MPEFKRSRRVSQLLREEISRIITQQLKDPLVGIVTVTGVNITDDLKLARVYVTILGDEKNRQDGLRGLERATKFIRGKIARRTNLKYIPELEFYYDETIDYAQNIELLLKKIHK
ncbi:30S ribosome-binding factor RbfA [candidate division KSB1 bacterium]|nr:30S ribosome-binding factor RbfA [candidate division KSB1 bacterium]MCH7755339.1 30S ribosome-binding factor RbfA [candidate division KSB1 bacterium]MCH8955335.1 30S ribosome-binding factor RbfA [candidate division KSB1 bacterium]